MKNGDFSSLLGASATGTDVNGNPVSFLKGTIYDPLTTTGTPCDADLANAVSRQHHSAEPLRSRIREDPPIVSRHRTRRSSPAASRQATTSTTLPASQQTDQGDARVTIASATKTTSSAPSAGEHQQDQRSSVPRVRWTTAASTVPGKSTSAATARSATRECGRRPVSETRASFTRLVTSRVGANADTDLFKEFGIGGYNPTTYTERRSADFAQRLHRFGGANGSPRSNTTTFGTSSRTWPSTRARTRSRSARSSARSSSRSSRCPIRTASSTTARTKQRYPRRKTSSLGPTVGARPATRSLPPCSGIDTATISTTNFISSQKVAWAFYVQDDWKISRKLTLNLGLRYELFSPIGERFGRQSNFDLQTMTLYIPKGKQQDLPLPPNFATAFPNVKVSRGQVSKYLIPWDKKDFGPRIGIAYQFVNKTVIRAGYGIFYGGEENQGGNPNRGEGIPFNETVTMTAPGHRIGVHRHFGSECTGCHYMPGGLTGGFPASPFTLNAPSSSAACSPISAIRWCTSGT